MGWWLWCLLVAPRWGGARQRHCSRPPLTLLSDFSITCGIAVPRLSSPFLCVAPGLLLSLAPLCCLSQLLLCLFLAHNLIFLH